MIGDLLTAIGDAIALSGAAVAAFFGYRAAAAGRQAVEQGRFALAEARTARHEERLFQELARLERLMGVVKRMWVILNRSAAARVLVSPGREIAAQELDALLYELRAALGGFDPYELRRSRHLADSYDGAALVAGGTHVQEAESEVVESINRCREALRRLANSGFGPTR